MVLARLVQLLLPRPGSRALVVGAGTGYGAAVLARMGAVVTAVEDDADLAAIAREALRRLPAARRGPLGGRASRARRRSLRRRPGRRRGARSAGAAFRHARPRRQARGGARGRAAQRHGGPRTARRRCLHRHARFRLRSGGPACLRAAGALRVLNCCPRPPTRLGRASPPWMRSVSRATRPRPMRAARDARHWHAPESGYGALDAPGICTGVATRPARWGAGRTLRRRASPLARPPGRPIAAAGSRRRPGWTTIAGRGGAAKEGPDQHDPPPTPQSIAPRPRARAGAARLRCRGGGRAAGAFADPVGGARADLLQQPHLAGGARPASHGGRERAAGPGRLAAHRVRLRRRRACRIPRSRALALGLRSRRSTGTSSSRHARPTPAAAPPTSSAARSPATSPSPSRCSAAAAPSPPPAAPRTRCWRSARACCKRSSRSCSRPIEAYVNVIRDQELLRLNINNEQVLTEQLRATSERFRVGEITRTDVAQAESRLAGARANRTQSEGNLQISRATFQRLVGAPPQRLVAPQPLRPPVRTAQEAGLIAAANNPNVVAALFDEAQARDVIDIQLSNLAPQLSVMGQAFRNDNQLQPHTRITGGQLTANLTCAALPGRRRVLGGAAGAAGRAAFPPDGGRAAPRGDAAGDARPGSSTRARAPRWTRSAPPSAPPRSRSTACSARRSSAAAPRSRC